MGPGHRHCSLVRYTYLLKVTVNNVILTLFESHHIQKKRHEVAMSPQQIANRKSCG